VVNRGLVQAIRFPRALLPASTTLMELLAAIPTYLIMFVVAAAVGEAPSWRWLLLPAIIAWQTVFNFGAAMLAARLTSHFRDVQQLLPFFFRLLIYGSGVLFSVEAYVDDDRLHWLFVLNPIYDFIELARWSVMGQPLSLDVLVASLVWPVVMLLTGFFWFKSGEHTYDRV
jgi:teichoic acid transport system permease protein